MFKHLLVPTDGSPLSQQTIERALSFARDTKAEVTFFYAMPEYPMPYYGEGALLDPYTPEQFAKLARQQADDVLAAASALAQKEGVSARAHSSTGDAVYQEIINAAEKNGCDLIFMASHGRRGLSGLLLGSETQKVLTHSKIPVLVYR